MIAIIANLPLANSAASLDLASLRVLDLTQEGGEANTVVAWLTSLCGVLHAELTLTRATSIGGGSCLEESSGLNQTSEGNDLSTAEHRQALASNTKTPSSPALGILR